MLSFFGNQDNKRPSAGPMVSTVFVKQPAAKVKTGPIASTRPAVTSTFKSSSGSSSGPSRPSGSHASSSSSKLNNGHGSSHTHSNGTTKSSSSAPHAQSRIASSSTSSRLSSKPTNGSKPAAKRKISQVDRIQSESESESSPAGGSGLESDSDGGPSSSAHRDRDLHRKRSKHHLSLKDTKTGSPAVAGDERIGRAVFCPEQVDERGEWSRGWAGFVPGEEVVRGLRKGWAGGHGEGEKGVLDKYVAYLPQPGFEKAEPLPYVELLYPATGCREKFPLLTPTAAGEYSPLRELRTAIQMILEFYIPPSHQHIFGSLSDSLTDLELPASASRMQSPFPGALATPPPDASSPAGPPPLAPTGSTETIADAIRKALAPNRRDGPGLIRAMERFNLAMEDIQKDGTMAKWLASRGPDITQRDWAKLVDVVHDQAYSRVVGSYSKELAHPKRTEEIAKIVTDIEDSYGELRHIFMSKVIEQTNLNSNSVFVDLGSGVGNCVMQAALQAGCKSYGFELLPVPAHCARLQLREVQRRWSMWCLKGNLDVEVHEGDFRVHPEVARKLRDADVVLVNNEVFPSSLNRDLTDMFLDLKEGARIVSLKPFVPEGFRMNDSNCDSFAAIVKLHSYSYHRDWVSWKGDSGKYYIQVIDRSMRRKYEEEMNGGRRRR